MRPIAILSTLFIFFNRRTVNCVQTLKASAAAKENVGKWCVQERYFKVDKVRKVMHVIGTVRVFQQKIALDDAIGSHACSLEEALPCV
jgi:hypothetical protein